MTVQWYYVYVLYSLKDYKFYIGFTTNLKARVEQHNKGLNTSTQHRRPFIIVLAEAFINKKDAMEREKFYKSGRGREVLKKKLENTLNELYKKYKK